MFDWSMRYSEHADALLKKQLRNRIDIPKLMVQAEKQAGMSELNEIHAFLDRFCLTYLQADGTQREQMRQAMTSHLALIAHLGRYVRAVAARIQTAQHLDLLRIGFAALSIENYTYDPHLDDKAAYDARNLYSSLVQLFEAANRAGINAEPVIQAVATLSSTQASRADPESPSVQSMMAGFTQTDYFLNVIKQQK